MTRFNMLIATAWLLFGVVQLVTGDTTASLICCSTATIYTAVTRLGDRAHD